MCSTHAWYFYVTRQNCENAFVKWSMMSTTQVAWNSCFNAKTVFIIIYCSSKKQGEEKNIARSHAMMDVVEIESVYFIYFPLEQQQQLHSIEDYRCIMSICTWITKPYSQIPNPTTVVGSETSSFFSTQVKLWCLSWKIFREKTIRISQLSDEDLSVVIFIAF